MAHARQNSSHNSGLSMQFETLNENDEVVLQASPEEKQQLIDFIDASLNTDQIDLADHAFVSVPEVRAIRDAISGQADGDQLTLSRYEFVHLSQLATAWRGYGFGVHGEDADLDVSRHLVDGIHRMFDAAFPA